MIEKSKIAKLFMLSEKKMNTQLGKKLSKVEIPNPTNWWKLGLMEVAEHKDIKEISSSMTSNYVSEYASNLFY